MMIKRLKHLKNTTLPISWLACFGALNTALVTVVMLTVWATGGFAGAGLSTDGWVAMFIGIVLTSALGTVLMALVFFSSRDGVDERVFHATDIESQRGRGDESADASADQKDLVKPDPTAKSSP